VAGSIPFLCLALDLFSLGTRLLASLKCRRLNIPRNKMEREKGEEERALGLPPIEI
jgi:hypothetical protein